MGWWAVLYIYGALEIVVFPASHRGLSSSGEMLWAYPSPQQEVGGPGRDTFASEAWGQSPS